MLKIGLSQAVGRAQCQNHSNDAKIGGGVPLDRVN
jgi:hypothetical protein